MAEGLSSSELAGEITRHRAHAAEAGQQDGDVPSAEGQARITTGPCPSLRRSCWRWSPCSPPTRDSPRPNGTRSHRYVWPRPPPPGPRRTAPSNAQNLRNFDSSTFNTWFTAYVAGDTTAEAVAARRFRPAFKVAFDAWLATDPFTNAKAPPGPTYMPQYKQPELVHAATLDTKATEDYTLGVQAGSNADNYVRDTIYLATILFLIGISGHFRFLRIRLASSSSAES